MRTILPTLGPTRAASAKAYEFRTSPFGRKGRGRARETDAAYAYESEDQSASGVRAEMRVRQAQFGVGNVMAVENQDDDI
jgi:hypothetical protein